MNLFKRIAQLFARDFPKPDKTIMTLEEITAWWKSLPWKWQSQCEIIVYRIRKQAPNSTKPTMWKPLFNYEKRPNQFVAWRHCDDSFVPSAMMILGTLGVPGEIDDPYTIRVVRKWEDSPGMEKKEEICIANFTLTMEKENS